MKAIVTKGFRGLPDGEMVVRDFVEGDVVHGSLAEVAIREKWAKPTVAGGDAAPAPAAPPAPARAGKGSKGAKAAAKPEPEPERLDDDADDDDESEE